MLDQHHLEQHHRIDAGASIILAIERLHHFIQLCEVHRCIYLSQQMLLRHQLVYDYELYQTILSAHTQFPTFYFDDYTDKMEDYIQTYKELNLELDRKSVV